jgi:hypothetical protein
VAATMLPNIEAMAASPVGTSAMQFTYPRAVANPALKPFEHLNGDMVYDLANPLQNDILTKGSRYLRKLYGSSCCI